MIAASISSGWLDRALWKLRAVPSKLPKMEAGTPMRAAVSLIATVASDSDTPSRRPNEIVAAANWPWWLTESGVLVYS